MSFKILALVTSLLACITEGTDVKGFTVGGYTPAAFRAPSPNTVTSNTLSLTRKSGSRSAAYLQSIRKNTQVNGLYQYGVAPLTQEEEGEEYLTEIEFGSKSFSVILDTGSSDTWLVETGFTCVNQTSGALETEAECMFGPTYTVPSTFKDIPNENFNITYGDGEFLTGKFGFEAVTLAGITVPKQQVAVVNFAAWDGDDVSSGLVGLAYPAITSEFSGDNPTLDTEAKQIEYNPIFTTMYLDSLVAPLFSLAINRGNSGTNQAGFLALGGLPPVAFVPIFASTPIQILTLAAYNITTQYSFYTITPQALVYEESKHTHYGYGNWPNPFQPNGAQYIVDSGTTLLYLPTGQADAINALFDPPAVYSDDVGAYVVDCNAKAPELGVQIGGEVFFISPLDLILNSEGSCFTGVDDGGDGPYILGDVFLKNVVAVFDVGASEMRFAAREFY
ncbi:hypothetical protein MMC12_001074 [Toensbergia leucococca]|nr:hypothetical protein [Toensbergia leucococca]